MKTTSPTLIIVGRHIGFVSRREDTCSTLLMYTEQQYTIHKLQYHNKGMNTASVVKFVSLGSHTWTEFLV